MSVWNRQKEIIAVVKSIINDYKPKNVDIEEVARQISVHYIACLENRDEIINFLKFDNIKEDLEYFLSIIDDLSEYDCEI